MGSRKYVKGEVCNIPMTEKRKFLGVFYAADKEAFTTEQNWNNKEENLQTIM